MFFDVCAFCGRWPFSARRGGSVEDLLRLMDRGCLERALVSPLAGAFCSDAMAANEEIWPELRGRADRLLFAPVLNPTFPGRDADLKRCCEEYGASAVRVFPGFHGYAVASDVMGALLDECAQAEVPAVVTARLLDERHYPPAFQAPEMAAQDVASVAKAHPRTTVVLSFARAHEILPIRESGWPENLYTDLTGVQGPAGIVTELSAAPGVARLLSGTGLVLQYALPARMKVETSGLADADIAAILGENALKLFGGAQ